MFSISIFAEKFYDSTLLYIIRNKKVSRIYANFPFQKVNITLSTSVMLRSKQPSFDFPLANPGFSDFFQVLLRVTVELLLFYSIKVSATLFTEFFWFRKSDPFLRGSMLYRKITI